MKISCWVSVLGALCVNVLFVLVISIPSGFGSKGYIISVADLGLEQQRRQRTVPFVRVIRSSHSGQCCWPKMVWEIGNRQLQRHRIRKAFKKAVSEKAPKR